MLVHSVSSEGECPALACEWSIQTSQEPGQCSSPHCQKSVISRKKTFVTGTRLTSTLAGEGSKEAAAAAPRLLWRLSLDLLGQASACFADLLLSPLGASKQTPQAPTTGPSLGAGWLGRLLLHLGCGPACLACCPAEQASDAFLRLHQQRLSNHAAWH